MPGRLTAGSLLGSLRRPIPALLIVVLTLSAVGWDVWYDGVLQSRAESAVGDRLAGHVFALSSAMAERAALVEGLRAWTRTSPEPIQSEFDDVAQSLYQATTGIQAIQVVRGGLITHTYPYAGNEQVVGYDLRAHPDVRVRDGLTRAWQEERVTLSGPVELIQGGLGVILRRSAGAEGDSAATVAAIVLDVGSLLVDAGLPALTSAGLRVSARDLDGSVFFGQRAANGDAPVEAEVQLPEGSWTVSAFPTDGWQSLYAADLRASRLASVLILAFASLLILVLASERRRLEAAVLQRTHEVRISHEQLSAAMVAGRVSTWDWNLRTGQVLRSPSTGSLLGAATPTEGTIEDLIARVHPEDADLFNAAVAAAGEKGKFEAEYRIASPDGEYIWVREVGSALEVGAQGAVRIAGATADITWVKRLEERMLRGQRADLIGTLAGGVAHNFNNLLTVIIAELQMALSSSENDDARASIRAALAAAERTAVLTRQMLTFGQRDAVQPESLVFDEVCAEALELIRRAAMEHIVVEETFLAGAATVRMDRSRLIQVIANLAFNSLDAMSGGGSLTVRTGLDSGESTARIGRPGVVLEVIDTGSGIPREKASKVFDPFFTTKGAGVAGIGLATVRHIVHEAGGEIDMESEPGKGTTVRVVLPTEA